MWNRLRCWLNEVPLKNPIERRQAALFQGKVNALLILYTASRLVIRIAPGFLADLTVLSGDPLATPIERLLEIHMAQTWVGGALAYEA